MVIISDPENIKVYKNCDKSYTVSYSIQPHFSDLIYAYRPTIDIHACHVMAWYSGCSSKFNIARLGYS